MGLDEETALTTLLFYLKRRKKLTGLPLLNSAEAAEYLRGLYKSQAEVARKTGVSSDIIGALIKISKAPNAFKQIIRTGGIGLDASYRICTLKSSEDKVKLAKAAVDLHLNGMDVRHIAQYARRNPHIPIEVCVKRVLESKPVVERRHIVVMELQDATFQALRIEAEKLKSTSEDLARTVIENRLKPENIASFAMRDKMIIIALQEEPFQALKGEAKKLKLNLEEYAETTIQDWLAKSHF